MLLQAKGSPAGIVGRWRGEDSGMEARGGEEGARERRVV
jgi:hypothetical protein